jgi:hypothetical protein
MTSQRIWPALRHYADPVSEVDRRAAAYLAQLTRLAGQQAVDSGAIKLPATSLLVMPSCLALCSSIVD